jgi:hypothetical protein
MTTNFLVTATPSSWTIIRKVGSRTIDDALPDGNFMLICRVSSIGIADRDGGIVVPPDQARHQP